MSPPVEPDHVQVVVRYRPAGEAAAVGGDWYDAFLQPDGALVAVGDVAGHDIEAAASMAQLRSMLRGIGVYSGAGPAELLRGVDAAMTTLQVPTTATAVAARFEQDDDQAARGVTRVRWSNAGHLPPLVIDGGTVQQLLTARPELMLGVRSRVTRSESTTLLDRGATLVLYTDGLVERRDETVQDGIDRLCSTVQQLLGEPRELDDLCDELLAAMLPTAPDDDVTLVAVRLHRQDRPRPSEAGPTNIRTQEAVATGADQIAAACPFCRLVLSGALTSQRAAGSAPASAEVVDVAQMLLAAVWRATPPDSASPTRGAAAAPENLEEDPGLAVDPVAGCSS